MSTPYRGNRLMPDLILSDYILTGLAPARGVYWGLDDGRPCGCGMGARLAALGYTPGAIEALDEGEIPRILGVTPWYGAGFSAGFDGFPPDAEVAEQPGYLVGHADGVACAERVFGRAIR